MSSTVVGLILAAGPSRRFGGQAKPLVRFGGRPLVQRLATEAAASRLRDVIVVVGYRGEEVAPLTAGLPVSVVENPDWESGQSSSVKAGLRAVPEAADAVLFLPVDQPLVDRRLIDRLIGAYEARKSRIVVASHQGRRGTPVLFDRSLFGALSRITGDAGGRQLFPRFEDQIETVEVADPHLLADVDTPEELERLEAAARDRAEPFAIPTPSGRDSIVAALTRQRREMEAYFRSFSTEELLAPQGAAWSPAEHLRHLTKSARPVASAMRWPRLFLALAFGPARRPSRSFDQVVEVYRQALADGGQAGRYGPSASTGPPDREEWRRIILQRWREAGRGLEAVTGRWPERALDRYRLPHPLLGKMTLREILFFTLYHNAHHARRVLERQRRGADA